MDVIKNNIFKKSKHHHSNGSNAKLERKEESKNLPNRYHQHHVQTTAPAPAPRAQIAAKSSRKIKALYDYLTPINPEEELSFNAGDIMILLNESENGWWHAMDTKTNKEGLVPSNYFTEILKKEELKSPKMPAKITEELVAEIKSGNRRRAPPPPPPIRPSTPTTPTIPITGAKKQVKAMYDYDVPPDSFDGLAFKKGEILDLIEDSDVDWWLAVSTRTNRQGYIPCNFVTRVEGIESFDWFHANVSRADTDKLLKGNKNNKAGTFLIRSSETIEGTYTISVLKIDNEGQRTTKHYHIRNMENNTGCYINPKAVFNSIAELIEFYSNHNGLCARLTNFCPKMLPVSSDLSKETRDRWEISRSTLQKIELLGSGNFGEVWKGLWKSTIPVAIKTMKPGTMEKKNFLEEAAVMKKLRHPKLVRLYAMCTTDEPIYIVMEYVANGSLQKFLRDDGGKTLTIHCLIDIAAQVANGMQYIESKGYIHRDLAARNVLISENRLIKIADFGLSRAVNEDIYKAAEDSKFPVKWAAIESIYSQIFTIKSDVWSFGILMVELLTFGTTPYPNMSNQEVQMRLQTSFRHPQPDGCSDELYEIMLSCWHRTPEKRPTFDALFHLLDDFLISTQGSYE